jgi:hypothetical protein
VGLGPPNFDSKQRKKVSAAPIFRYPHLLLWDVNRSDPFHKNAGRGMSEPRRKALLAAATTALAVIVPLFFLGVPSGHDFMFHAASWMEAARQWKQGVLYPRWAEWANYGYGEPRFIFYPPLSWMLGGALGLILPWVAVPGALIGLTVFLAAISMYVFARRWISREGALVAAVLYAANPYALVVIYLRSDFAEALAAALYPVALLAAFDLALGQRPVEPLAKPRTRHSVVLGAASFAAIWLTNAPAGVLATYSLALVFALGTWLRRLLRPGLTGAATLALGFLLSGFYLLPAAVEQRWVQITATLSAGLRPAESFLFTRTTDAEHTVFNLIVSVAAVGMILLAGIAAPLARRPRGAAREAAARQAWWLLLALAVVSTCLMLRWSKPLWTWVPKMAFLQFPWRWLFVLAAPMACFLAMAVAKSSKRAWWTMALLVLLAGAEWLLTREAWWSTPDIAVLRQAIAQGRGYEGTDEYDPLGDDRTELKQQASRVMLLGEPPAQTQVGPTNDSHDEAAEQEADRIRVVLWEPEDKLIAVKTRRPRRVALRLLDYPAWRVTVNGRVVCPERPEQTTQMLIPVGEGESRIHAVFRRTRDRTAGLALSGAGLAVWLALFAMARRKSTAIA